MLHRNHRKPLSKAARAALEPAAGVSAAARRSSSSRAPSARESWSSPKRCWAHAWGHRSHGGLTRLLADRGFVARARTGFVGCRLLVTVPRGATEPCVKCQCKTSKLTHQHTSQSLNQTIVQPTSKQTQRKTEGKTNRMSYRQSVCDCRLRCAETSRVTPRSSPGPHRRCADRR